MGQDNLEMSYSIMVYCVCQYWTLQNNRQDIFYIYASCCLRFILKSEKTIVYRGFCFIVFMPIMRQATYALTGMRQLLKRCGFATDPVHLILTLYTLYNKVSCYVHNSALMFTTEIVN